MKIEEYIQQTPDCKIATKSGLFGKQYTYTPTGARMRLYRRYVTSGDRQRLREALEKGDTSILGSIEAQVSTNTMLTILLAQDASAALVQLSEYIPHDFVPMTDPMLVTGHDVDAIKAFVK